MTADFPLQVWVRKLNSHVTLSEQDMEALLGLPHTMREMTPSSFVVREGEAPGPCAVLISGFAFRQKLVVDGARQILSVQMPGDALGMQHLFLDSADHSVQALTTVTIAMIPALALHQIAYDRPAVARAFAVSDQVETSIAREWLVNVGRRDARTRIAHLLCEIATRLKQQNLVDEYGYELPMSQEQLGDATGLTSVHVNRTLKTLERQGLITRDKRAIRFPNWTLMKNVADFDPLYLHVGQQSSSDVTAELRPPPQTSPYPRVRAPR